jgi:hypothetical protein
VLTNVVTSLETGVTNRGNIFLVDLPGQTLLFEKIVDSRDMSGDVVVIIVVDTEVGSTTSGNVVGFRRMGNSVEVIQEDTLLEELLESRDSSNNIVILFYKKINH